MTSFMSKKKKYKFQVEICLEEMLAVPFVSAVLFAKLRLLDGGSFQDHSSRQEVRDHKVTWDSNFSFPCKMMANASTGVMEKCILRISIRKECKGGRSFTKLGFVDLNLAEYAGAGVIHKKALLEGYDTRHRQDNSMLKFRLQLNMISGDILFKVPSPSLKHKQTLMDDAAADQRSDEFSSGSLAGSINSGSSGFGSLPKKRPQLMTSEIVIGQTLPESGGASASTPSDQSSTEIAPFIVHCEQVTDHVTVANTQEPGHSRNSSNTSQMSRASGYSSISHSRQSSSGDSAAGHIRNAFQHQSLRRPSSKFQRTYTLPKHRLYIPTTILSESFGPSALNTSTPEVFHTPQGSLGGSEDATPTAPLANGLCDGFHTPICDDDTPKKVKELGNDLEVGGDLTDDVFCTPEGSFSTKTDVFSRNFNALQKSASNSMVEWIKKVEVVENDTKKSSNVELEVVEVNVRSKAYTYEKNRNVKSLAPSGLRYSKSDFQIPKVSPEETRKDRSFSQIISSFLTPRMSRKNAAHSTPIKDGFGLTTPPTFTLSNQESRAVSMGNLRMGNEGLLLVPGTVIRNPSSGSLATSSEGGSLERAKAAFERRKKIPGGQEEGSVAARVENTRIDPENFIAELLKSTNLEQPDDSAETSGLQLFIAKDGTAALGNHEVKSQMSTGVNTFKQVVMDDR
ncbi:uncharacterized protein LOC143195290 [Rhynchophorus ferrugineus]|uniref:uncharacterized protein LOC143195290 n=1 Tax=Rhynchophorus ferrugineus TaxID=354439 RepID=UPI003FCDD77C